VYELPIKDNSKAEQRRLLQYAPVRRMTPQELVKVQRCRDMYFKPKAQKQSDDKKAAEDSLGDPRQGPGEAEDIKTGSKPPPAKGGNEPADKSAGDGQVIYFMFGVSARMLTMLNIDTANPRSREGVVLAIARRRPSCTMNPKNLGPTG